MISRNRWLALLSTLAAPACLDAPSASPPVPDPVAVAYAVEDVDVAAALENSVLDFDSGTAACRSIPAAPHYADWPRIQSPIRKDPAQEAWIRRVVESMTLEQKVGQMTQAEIVSLFDPQTQTYRLNEITEFNLGSVLGGGSTTAKQNKHAALQDWVDLADSVWKAGPTIALKNGRHTTPLHIPHARSVVRPGQRLRELTEEYRGSRPTAVVAWSAPTAGGARS